MIKKHLIVRSLVVALAAFIAFAGGTPMVAAKEASDVHIDIINGHNATQPWAVALQSLGPNGATFECGGVLIAPNWVLTAAHCTPYTTGQARVGSLNWKQGGEVVAISQVFANPKHDSSKNFGNDIGLVKLASSVTTQTVPIGFYGPVDTVGITQGWGITCDIDVTAPGCGDQTPDLLQELSMRRTTDHFCDLTNSAGVQLNDPATMMCVVTADGSHAGTCFGDSGSPFLETIHDKKAVTGIMIALMNNTVATPHVCSQTPNGGPNRDAATKVKVMVPWIIQTLGQNDPVAAQYVQTRIISN
jgi:secreted trypsin-like serine protease